MAATLNAPLDPKLSRPHPLHKKSESIVFLRSSSPMMQWPSMCRCKIVGVIVSIGNFLLKSRGKMCFCFLVNTCRYRTGRVHECWGWWRVACAKGERRGFLSEGCYSSHFCCPTKRGRVYLKCRLFHENARSQSITMWSGDLTCIVISSTCLKYQLKRHP